MNIQEIDKWLDNEYGCSYTRLEELHDYFFEKYTDQKEEIERLNNIINELEKYIGSKMNSFGICNSSDIYYKLQELKHKKIYGSVDSEVLYYDELGSVSNE